MATVHVLQGKVRVRRLCPRTEFKLQHGVLNSSGQQGRRAAHRRSKVRFSVFEFDGAPLRPAMPALQSPGDHIFYCWHFGVLGHIAGESPNFGKPSLKCHPTRGGKWLTLQSPV